MFKQCPFCFAKIPISTRHGFGSSILPHLQVCTSNPEVAKSRPICYVPPHRDEHVGCPPTPAPNSTPFSFPASTFCPTVPSPPHVSSPPINVHFFGIEDFPVRPETLPTVAGVSTSFHPNNSFHPALSSSSSDTSTDSNSQSCFNGSCNRHVDSFPNYKETRRYCVQTVEHVGYLSCPICFKPLQFNYHYAGPSQFARLPVDPNIVSITSFMDAMNHVYACMHKRNFQDRETV
jgi:hypothetical protein